MDIPPDTPQAVETVILSFSADELKGDIFSKPDTRLALYMKHVDEKKYNPVATSELIWDKKKCTFTHQIAVPWSMEQHQYRLALFECDNVFQGPDDPAPRITKNTHIIEATLGGRHFWIYSPNGHVDFRIEDLLQGPVTYQAVTKKGKSVGKSTITITAFRFPASRKYVAMRFKIKKFKRSSFFALLDKDDMYCQVVNINFGKEAVIHTTPIVFDTQSPKYPHFVLPYGLFDANIDAQFRIDVYRFKSKHGVELVGRTKPLSLANYLINEQKGKKHKLDAFDPEKMSKDMCDILIKQLEIRDDANFNYQLNCNPTMIPQPAPQFGPFKRDFKK